jgi:hypothetical protein
MRQAGHIARMGDIRIAYKILVGKPKGKRPLRRPHDGGNKHLLNVGKLQANYTAQNSRRQ